MNGCDNGLCNGYEKNLHGELSNEIEEVDGKIISLSDLCCEAKNEFQKKYSRKPTNCAYAPGRVVLSGEHVDYSDGFVLPVAIPLYTVIVGLPCDDTDSRCEICSTSIPEDENFVEIDLKSEIQPGKPAWANYIRGVLALYKGTVNSFKALIHSSIPLGGGLSSSASLEVAMLLFLESIASGKPILSLKEKAVLCEKAEHDYAGVMCGIMDQYVSTMARENTALLVDCRSLESQHIPFNCDDLVLLVSDTMMKHELNGVHAKEFAIRHRMCMESAKIMNKSALRDVSLEELHERKHLLGETRFKRAKFAVTEISRTIKAAKALKENDLYDFGQIMIQGHKSLKNDYEVSCRELNRLVQLALECEGVFGSRLTGGGFGGCTVTLIKRDHCANCMAHIKINYPGPLRFYVCKPANGAGTMSLDNVNCFSNSFL